MGALRLRLLILLWHGPFVVVMLSTAACPRPTASLSVEADAGSAMPRVRDAGGSAMPEVRDAGVDQADGANEPSKREALTKAVGTYKLASIQSNTGANTLLDIWTRQGRWSASSSHLVGGASGFHREAAAIELTREDIAALGSMSVVVDATLTVRVLAKGKILVQTPFDEARMDYRIHDRDAGDRSELSQLDANTRFVDGQWYLSFIDGVKYADVFATHSGFRFVDEERAGKSSLTYSPANDSFDMRLFPESCCDEDRFHFVK